MSVLFVLIWMCTSLDPPHITPFQQHPPHDIPLHVHFKPFAIPEPLCQLQLRDLNYTYFQTFVSFWRKMLSKFVFWSLNFMDDTYHYWSFSLLNCYTI